MKFQSDFTITVATDQNIAYQAQLDSSVPRPEAAVNVLIAKVEGPKGFVDTMPFRRGLVNCHGVLAQLEKEAGYKPPAAESASTPGAPAKPAGKPAGEKKP